MNKIKIQKLRPPFARIRVVHDLLKHSFFQRSTFAIKNSLFPKISSLKFNNHVGMFLYKL